jgi:hypothetical protein
LEVEFEQDMNDSISLEAERLDNSQVKGGDVSMLYASYNFKQLITMEEMWGKP